MTIGDTSYLPRKGENVPIFDGVPESKVKDYFTQLAGVDKLPEAVPIMKDGKQVGVRYTINTPEGSFNLRDYSGSTTQSGNAWTIDFPKTLMPPGVVRSQRPEIKFGR